MHFRNVKPTTGQLALLQQRWLDHPWYDRCVGHFLFESGASFPRDVSIYSHQTAFISDPFWTSTPQGPGLDFTTDAVRVVNSSGAGHPLDVVSGDEFTISGYVRVDATDATILSKRNGTVSQYQVFVDLSASAERFHVRGDAEVCFVNDHSLTFGAWYRFAVLIDSSGNVTVYVDGILKSVQNVTGTLPFTFTHQDVDVAFGARWSTDPAITFTMDGVIGELCFHRRLLTESEIVDRYYEPFLPFIWASERVNRTYSIPPAPISNSSAGLYYRMMLN